VNRTAAAGSSGGMYVDKAEGVSGTKLTAADHNQHQEELIAVIAGGGLTPDSGVLTQVRDAIRNIAVPVDFVYTQLPGMVNPATLWPWATWAEISSNVWRRTA